MSPCLRVLRGHVRDSSIIPRNGSSIASQVWRHGGARIRARRLRAEDVGAKPQTRAAASAGAAAGGQRVVGSRHSHHHRPAPASPIRVRAQAPSSSTPRRSSTTSATAARACRCRGARRRWPPTGAGAYRAHGRGDGIGRRRPDLRARAAAARLRRHDLRGHRSARHHVEHVAGRLHADLGSRRHQPSARREWDAQFRAGGRDRVSPPAAARGSEVRHHLDHELRADGQRAAGRGGFGGATRTRCCRRALPDPRVHPAARRASVPDEICDRAHRDAHRAVDLSRRADERLPAVGRQGGDPEVRDAARRCRAAARTSSSTAPASARRRSSTIPS